MSKEPTILHFIYIKNETIKLNNHIAYITCSSIENKITLDNNNEAKLNIALNETSIYYNELVEIYFNNNLHFESYCNIAFKKETASFDKVIGKVYSPFLFLFVILSLIVLQKLLYL